MIPSVTQLLDYRQCPRRFYHRVILKQDKPTPEMELGTRYHAAMEAYLRGVDPWAKLTFGFDGMADLFDATEAEFGTPPKIVPDGVEFIRCEQRLRVGEGSFAWSGKPDLLWIEGDVLNVLDYKSGANPMQDRPEKDDQLRAYAALCLAQEGWPEINGVVLRKFYPALGRYEVSDTLSPDSLKHDADELECLAYEASLTDPTRSGEWQPIQNEYCGSCAFRAGCPIFQEAAKLTLPPMAALDTREDALNVAQALPLAKRALLDLEARLRAYVAENGPLEAPDGSVYGPSPSARYQVDMRMLATVMAQHGRPLADLLPILTTSKAKAEKLFPGKGNKDARTDVRSAFEKIETERWGWSQPKTKGDNDV